MEGDKLLTEFDFAILEWESCACDPVIKFGIIKGLQIAKEIILQARPRKPLVYEETVEFLDPDIACADYNKALMLLRVTFPSGSVRVHRRVPIFYWEKLKREEDPKDFYAQHICAFSWTERKGAA